MVEEVLSRLAKDPKAAHLWHWQAKPNCADEPEGPSRRNHLRTLLGMMGAAAVPAAATGCISQSVIVGSDGGDSKLPPDAPRQGDACADDPCAVLPDAAPDKGPRVCADDPCAVLPDSGLPDALPDALDCADDPCNCGDDPCAIPLDAGVKKDLAGCGDDPCACADDPCACADDPCP